MKNLPQSNNVVVNILLSQGTTEGSCVERFIRVIYSVFSARETLVLGLQEISGNDAVMLCEQANGIAYIIRHLSESSRDSVIQAWLETSSTDSKLGAELVFWIGQYKIDVSTSVFKQFLTYAEEELVRSKEKRDLFVRLFLDPEKYWPIHRLENYRSIEIPTELAEIIRLEELEALKIQASLLQQAQVEKENLTRHLSSLSFFDRVKYFQQIKSSKLEKAAYDCWNKDWGTCSETELVQYSADEIQELINWCESQSRMYYARPQLHERRHQLRLHAMNQVRENLKAFPIESWLNELLLIDAIPIEHYPVELAAQATTEWFASLEPEVGKKFLSMLMGTKLRVWTKVVDRLTPTKS
jgi:hypothetical protein